MSIITALDAPALLRRHGLRPNRRLGQNFLQDPDALHRITLESKVGKADTVLEIGAGLGSLTRHLAAAAGRVIAVELDERLAAIAREVLAPYSNVHLICGDILGLSTDDLGVPAEYVVAANIPYHITSPILRHLLESKSKPRRLVLTVQEEVAERICSHPPAMNLLALSVQVYGATEIVARIAAGAFYPVPKVDSAVVRVEMYAESLIPATQLSVFFSLVRAGFSQRRKTLRNSLSAALRISPERARLLLLDAGIEPQRRAESLRFIEWGKLCRHTAIAGLADEIRRSAPTAKQA